MATASLPLLHVAPDERGRVALGKAIEALNERLSTVVNGFDIRISDAGELVLKPTVSVPADAAIVLNKTDWRRLTEILEEDGAPNENLQQAAKRYARDRITAPPSTPLH